MKLWTLLLPASLLLVLGCAAARAPAEAPATKGPAPCIGAPFYTFSIVARDPATGEMGVAVQSHWFNVGPIVPWAEAGVGAIATQSFANASFGPRGLELLQSGKSPDEALKTLLGSDPGEAMRQVAIVDAHGAVAAHTGARCIAWAGHRTGAGFSVQANIMWSDAIVPAMEKAFTAAEGPLAHRLLVALEAAQAAGGDLRGQQSAALRVVAAKSTGDPARDVVCDLRVEDHPRPVEELRRIYGVYQAYAHMNAGDAAMEKPDFELAMREYAAAAELAPDNAEIRFWTAFTLAKNRRLDEAVAIFRGVLTEDERWVELLRRLPAAELCEQELVDEIEKRVRDDGGR